MYIKNMDWLLEPHITRDHQLLYTRPTPRHTHCGLPIVTKMQDFTPLAFLIMLYYCAHTIAAPQAAPASSSLLSSYIASPTGTGSSDVATGETIDSSVLDGIVLDPSTGPDPVIDVDNYVIPVSPPDLQPFIVPVASSDTAASIGTDKKSKRDFAPTSYIDVKQDPHNGVLEDSMTYPSKSGTTHS